GRGGSAHLCAAGETGRVDQNLAVEAAGAEQRRVEVLEPVRGAHDDYLVALLEPVELDEQLVERLVLLAVEAVPCARGAYRVELVDEDDRRCVLPRLFEELANSRGPEPGEHLDERRRALQVEARSGFACDRLGQKRLAGPWRAGEGGSLRGPGGGAAEPPRVAEEVNDLSELLLGLLEPGH